MPYAKELEEGVFELAPQPGPQTDFLATPADIAFFGGEAGGGKSGGLLLAAAAMHMLVRNSYAFELAVSAYQLRTPSGSDADVDYCYLCSSGISYGGGSWHYRFTLIDRRSGAKTRAHVRMATAGSSTVTFN